MGMIIGSKGSNFRDIQDIPEVDACNLHQPTPNLGGTLVVKGSVRACVVAAERVGKIIDVSFERNVRSFTASISGPIRPRYDRPSTRRRFDPVRRSPSPGAGVDPEEALPLAEELDADEKREWSKRARESPR